MLGRECLGSLALFVVAFGDDALHVDEDYVRSMML